MTTPTPRAFAIHDRVIVTDKGAGTVTRLGKSIVWVLLDTGELELAYRLNVNKL